MPALIDWTTTMTAKSDPGGAKEQTTIRIYRDTAKKIGKLAALVEKAVPDVIDELVLELLDHQLLTAMDQERDGIQGRKGKPPRKPRGDSA